MDRLTSMSVFVRAVDLGSFAAAAAAMGLSGPMVGKHVRFLEDRLGARLLNRTTRRQSLTEFGRAYYDRCRVVLAEADAADALAGDLLGEPGGRLRVTMPALFGRHCVTPVLLELAGRHPRLELELSLGDAIADMSQGGHDLAVRTGRLPDIAGLTVRRVARQPMVVCAAPSYLAARGAPRSLDDLPKHSGVIYSRSGRVGPWLFPRDGAPPVEVVLPSRHRLDDMEAIADAAAQGLGLAWLPHWLVRRRLEAGELTVVLNEEPSYLYDCHALWPTTPHLPLKVRAAVDVLASRLPGMMGQAPVSARRLPAAG